MELIMTKDNPERNEIWREIIATETDAAGQIALEIH
jgi:hypothetical protein